MPQATDEAGNIWETDAQGNAVRLLQAAGAQQGQVFDLPADPVEQARLEMERQRVAIAQQGAGNAAAMQPLQQDLLRAQIAKAQADATKATQGTAGAATGDAKLQARSANINALVQQLNRVQSLYESGPGSTSGIYGIQDLIPSPENAQFNSAAAGLAEQGMAAFRVPGVGAQSDTELRQFVEANRPSASDYDTSIEEKLRQLRLRVDSTRQSMGLPPAQWDGFPQASDQQAPQDNRPNALMVPRIINSGGPGAAGFGADTKGVPINPQYQADYEAFVRSGNFTPESYNQFRQAQDAKYNYAPGTDYTAEGQRIADQLKTGGTLNLTIPPAEAPMNGGERFQNDMAANPIGAAAINFADMGGFGGVTALAGDQMQALNEAEPWGALAGQIGGSIAGTGMLASALRNTAGRAAPSLLAGGGKAAFGRGLGTDVAYSGIYGANTGQDPLTTAVEGGVGSLLGQGAGKVLGTAIGGVNLAPAAEYLRGRGVPLTLGQSLGGTAKRVEDAMTSLPVAGDMVGQRRLEGFQAFNQAAFNDAGAPINATVGTIGENGVQSLVDATGNAYDSATAGVTVPLDGPFWGDLQGVAAQARMLPGDHASRFQKAMDNRMAPIAEAGQMTGEQYQQAMRGLKTYRAGAPRDGFEGDYRDALSGGMDALTGAMTRGGGDSVVTGLSNADQAYRGAKTLKRAVQAAKNGTGSGEIQTFTPAQLNSASTQAADKFGGKRQFAELIDAGQQVLPSTVPDSGTARRALQAGLGGAGVMGAAGGVDYATGGDYNAMAKTAAVLALLTAGGTRGGQKALDALVIRRPELAQKIGQGVRKHKGLFGRAAVGPLIAK